MPGRKIPLVAGQIYHVLNRGISSQPIFLTKKDYQRMMETILYYQRQGLSLSYTHFLRLSAKQKIEISERLRGKEKFLVEIIALCLMPNHFHLLLKQIQENGISTFMSNLTNSYTRYFNIKNERIGPLFQGKFKAVIIETDEQLIHVSRYIHLNPHSSFVIKNLQGLENYLYSSLPEYLGQSKTNFFQKEIVLDQFENLKSYKKFVFDQAEYQRHLEEIKHLLME
ncbi:transposase [Candidatus Microgenomates bacterium]|nr:transposase [Candidatus Microgenomates bacterium]